MKLSRREVLVSATLAPFGISAAHGLQSEGDSTEIVFFSDTHVSIARNITENREMLTKIEAFCTPEIVINGGDVTDYGWAEEYDEYDALLKTFPWPVVNTMGNHDVRWSPKGEKIFRERLGPPYQRIEGTHATVFVLDSTVPLSHWGHYSSVQLKWLATELEKIGTERPVILATHHWVGRDSVMIDNEESLRQILKPYNVILILNGHGHNDLLWEWDGIPCTMNRGLYQGSWESIRFNPEAQTFQLLRYTKESGALVPILEKSLTNRRMTPVLPSLLAEGKISGSYNTYRVNSGPWAKTEGQSVDVPGLIDGRNVVTGRIKGRWRTEIVTQDSEVFDAAWTLSLGGEVMSHLVERDGMISASALDGSLILVHAETGALAWRAQHGLYCHSTPLFAENRVVVGSADGMLSSYAIETGERSWQVQTDGPVYAGATFAKGVIVVASGDGIVYGVRLSNGEVLWKTPMPGSRTAFAQSRATTDGERVFFTAWDSHLYCVNPESGAILWRKPCQPRTFAFSPAIGSPCVAEGSVWCVANGNGLFRFDAKSGEQIYEVAAPGDKFGHSSAVWDGGRIYAGGLGDNGSVWGVDAESGKVEWECRTGSIIYDSSPSISGDRLAIGSVASQLNLIDKRNGALLGKFRLKEGHFLSTPLLRGDRVYAATFNGELVCLKLKK